MEPSSPWLSGIVRSRSDSFKTPIHSRPDNAGRDLGSILSKGRLHGTMFKYGAKPIQVAFKSGDFKQQVIFIAGLSEGFLATEYLESLAAALANEKWSLVQFLLSSSYNGYGTSGLRQDATELDQLIRYFIYKEESDGVVLLGHSTGCQDIVCYLRSNAMCSVAVRAAILQAPVSDREYKAAYPETASMIDLASQMISEGRQSEFMPREVNLDAPITAYRFHSLYGYNGDDDMFSSDFSENQLKQKLGHMSKIPTLVIYSMADEFVPHYIDKVALVDRLCRAMGGAEKVQIDYGNHMLSNRIEVAVRTIVAFVKTKDGNGESMELEECVVVVPMSCHIFIFRDVHML